MTVHYYQPDHYHLTFGSHEPVLRIRDGDTVVTSTIDAFGCDARGEQVAPRGNPQTGPFFVEGAEPGDMLQVCLDRLIPSRNVGYSNRALAVNTVDPDVVSEIPPQFLSEWRLDLTLGVASIREVGSLSKTLSLPLAPMLGCLGVAPPGDQAISTATSGPYGGNMDYRGFVEGTIAYFPVFVPGALFYVGDGHALQGAGEIVGTGVEVPLEVHFTVQVIRGCKIGWPRGENSEFIFALGNARPLDQAFQHATTEMVHWLQEGGRLDAVAAHLLLGHCVEYEVGNFFDPAYTMVCKLPKRVLVDVGWCVGAR